MKILSKPQKAAVYAALLFSVYVAVSISFDVLTEREYDLVQTTVVGITFSAIMTWFFIRGLKNNAEPAFVPKEAVREGLDFTDTDALRDYLVKESERLQKAKCATVADGLEFHFSQMFGWKRYTVAVKTQEAGVQIEGEDTSPVFKTDDYHIRLRVLEIRRLISDK